MKQLSIRKLMLMIAGLAVVFAIIGWQVRRSEDEFLRVSRDKCAHNMHKIALTLLGYCTTNGAFPSGTWPNPSLPPERRLSWYAAISSFLDYALFHNAIEETQPWDAGPNGNVVCMRNSALFCPNANGVRPGTPVPTHYIGIAGVGTDAPLLLKSDPRAGVFGYDRQTTLADIKDGLATTMLIAESGRVKGAWLQGGPATVRGLDPADKPYAGPGRQFGGFHPGCVLIAFADGSVRVVDERIDPTVFEALSTMAGGERLPTNW
ncbi:MAG: DUF1559 domain-containing protein [Isosphaerales bacterium]